MNAAVKEATAPPIAMVDPAQAYALAPRVDSQAMILHGDYFDRIERLATHLSKAKGAVPEFLLGNIGACIDVAMTAMRAGFNPYGVARKCWMGPNGVIQYESQLAIALINNSGVLADRLNWEYFGDWPRILGKFERRQTKKKDRDGNLVTDTNGEVKTYLAKLWKDSDEVGLGVRCFATVRGEKQPRITELLMAQAITRNSTLWVEDPRQQIGYLSGFRWGRLHTPEAIMGIYTPDDPFNNGPSGEEPEGSDVDHMLLKRAEEAAAKGREAYQAFWKECTHGDRAELSEKTKHHDRLKALAATVSEAGNGRRPPPPPPAPPASTPAPTTAPSTAPAAGPAATPAPTTGPTPAPQPTAAPQAGTPMTYAQVMNRMLIASEKKDVDLLDVEADWIRDVQDEGQRKELTDKYSELRSAIEAGGSK